MVSLHQEHPPPPVPVSEIFTLTCRKQLLIIKASLYLKLLSKDFMFTVELKG